MFHMAYGLGLKHIPPQQDTEIRMAVTIRMPTPVFLKEFAYRDPFPFQAGGVFGRRASSSIRRSEGSLTRDLPPTNIP